ncbi:hypothetical protein DVK02_19425, partial [Halobellus sp. Atlit-31R]
MRHYLSSALSANRARLAAMLATLLGAVLLSSCRLRETGQEDLVLPELVRTHLYVSPSGSDSNPGTRDEPFRTLTRAAQAV